jgi:hypothetical protein
MKITIEDLLVKEEYANISIEDLANIIGNKLSFEEFIELEGWLSDDKAERLFKQQWGRTTANRLATR